MKNKVIITFILMSILPFGYICGQKERKLLPAEQEVLLEYGADCLWKQKDCGFICPEIER